VSWSWQTVWGSRVVGQESARVKGDGEGDGGVGDGGGGVVGEVEVAGEAEARIPVYWVPKSISEAERLRAAAWV
jgi:hypothetical protein